METKKKHFVDEEILNHFWSLAEIDEEKRINALNALIKSLTEKQGDNSTNPCVEVNYSVNRLIKGLSSGRDCARLGFVAALQQVLKCYQFFTLPQLMQMVEEKLKHDKTDKKADISQLFIGRLLAYSCFVKVFNIAELEVSELVNLIEKVLHAGKKKSFLGQITLEILYEIMSKFDKVHFKENIWPLIEEKMCKGWLLTAIISGLKTQEIKNGSELLIGWAVMDVIRGTDRTSEQKQVFNMDIRRKWALSTLISLVAHGSTSDQTWLLHLMQFFAMAAFFEVQSPASELPHSDKLYGAEISTEFRSELQNGFSRALGKIAVSSSGKLSCMKSFKEFLFQLLSYVQLLLKSSSKVLALADILMKEDENKWKKILKTVTKLRSQEESGMSSLSEAFQLLLLHQGLQLWLNHGDSREDLEEIQKCCQRALQTSKTVKKTKDLGDEPMWIDVLVDVLMHLLLQESHLTRNVVKMASYLLHSEFTLNSIQLITQVLDPSKDEDVGFENDESGSEDDAGENEEDSDEEPEDTNEAANDEECALSDDEENEDMDEEDEGGNVDSKFRDAVKAALGKAAIPSDAEESLSELDDDEMMKIDEMSAKILRERADRKKQAKERQMKLIHYKLRCLDLIEEVVHNTTSVAVLFDLIMPLLKLMKTEKDRQEFQELSGRARKILNEISKRNKLDNDKVLSHEELFEFLSKIQNSMKVIKNTMSRDVVNCCLFVLRIALCLDNECQKQDEAANNGVLAETSRQSTLKEIIFDFFERKESKMQPLFVRTIVEKYPIVAWPLREQVLAYVLSSDCRVFNRTHACMLLVTLTAQKTVRDLDGYQEFVNHLIEDISKLLMDLDKSEPKPKFVEQLLTLICQLFSAIKEPASQEIKEKLGPKIETLRKISKDVRKQCNRLMGLLQKNSSTKKDKKRKRLIEAMETDDISNIHKKTKCDQEQITKSKNKKNSKNQVLKRLRPKTLKMSLCLPQENKKRNVLKQRQQ